MHHSIQEIETLVRARYPIIYIVSWEEERVQEYIHEIAKKRNKQLLLWSFTTGILPYGVSLQSQKHSNTATKDPLVALDEIITRVEPTIYIFKDFHPFLSHNNFAVIRRLKEVAMQIKDSYKTVIVISPVLKVPVELEKEITVVDFPLPLLEDFSQLFDNILQDISDNPHIKIEVTPEDREKLLQAALGLTLSEAENVFAKILVTNHGKLDHTMIDMIFAEKRQIIRKSGLLEYCEPSVDIRSLGGLKVLKQWLTKRKVAFSAKAKNFGLPAPKGVLLLGVQGCGKSLCAKSISKLWNLPLLRFDIGKVFNSLVGSSEENIRRAIQISETISPCILWIDEIDKAFSGASNALDNGTTARVFATFLTWLSEKVKPVFVVATANDISQLPPELMRKGRLDEIFFIDLPSLSERQEIFAIHLVKRQRSPKKFDVSKLAEATEGFSGSEIEEAIISALYDVFYNSTPLTTDDILQSIRNTIPLSRTMEEKLQEIRSWSHGRARNASVQQQQNAPHLRKIEISEKTL